MVAPDSTKPARGIERGLWASKRDGRAGRASPIPLRHLAAGLFLLAACVPSRDQAAVGQGLLPDRRPTSTPSAAFGIIWPGPTPTFTPAPIYRDDPALPPAGNGILDTLRDFTIQPDRDPEGTKAAALKTLIDFTNPLGSYAGAWWFDRDGRASIDEVLAVILFTEGSTSMKVQRAVAARYIWYCGGTSTACSGRQLINFLAYFQPWREPWVAGENFTDPSAMAYLRIANGLVSQRADFLTDWIPGADRYVHDSYGLYEDGPVEWESTPFHFANVHPSWDRYLRQKLGRGPDGANRLWVLTIGEAGLACRSRFICENMTLARGR